MAYRNEKKVPTLNEQGKLDEKFLPENAVTPISQEYVDAGDQASKDYTDQKISEIDFPDGDITEAEVDAKDATTLASAKTYTDTKISEIDFPEGDITEAEVDAKNVVTLAKAKEYVDALPEDFQKISVTSLDEVSSDFSGLIEVEAPEFTLREPELGGSLELVSSNADGSVWDLYEFDDDGTPVALNLRNSEELTFTFSSISRPVGVGIYFTIPELPQLTPEEIQQSGWGINSDFMNLSPGVRYEQNGDNWDTIHDIWSVNVAGYNVKNIAPGASLDLAVYQAMDGEVVAFIDGVEVHRSGGIDSGYPTLGIPNFTVRGLNFTNLRDVPPIPVSKYYLQVEDHEPVRLVGKDAIATWLQWDIVTKADLRKAIENIPLPTADVTKSYVDTELTKKADTSHKHGIADLTTTDTASASTFLAGDGSWKIPAGATNAQIEAAVNAYLAENPPSAGQVVTFVSGLADTSRSYASNNFNAVAYGQPSTNIGGGVWSNTTTWYAPVTGTYLIVGSIRFPDNSGVGQFSTGIHTQPADGAHGLWAFNVSTSIRPMTQYTRIMRLTQGQGLMQYVFPDKTVTVIPSGQGCSWSATLLSAG